VRTSRMSDQNISEGEGKESPETRPSRITGFLDNPNVPLEMFAAASSVSDWMKREGVTHFMGLQLRDFGEDPPVETPETKRVILPYTPPPADSTVPRTQDLSTPDLAAKVRDGLDSGTIYLNPILEALARILEECVSLKPGDETQLPPDYSSMPTAELARQMRTEYPSPYLECLTRLLEADAKNHDMLAAGEMKWRGLCERFVEIVEMKSSTMSESEEWYRRWTELHVEIKTALGVPLSVFQAVTKTMRETGITPSTTPQVQPEVAP
jgi:hypothetical protein